MARTIESPGVEIRERDLTLSVAPLVGTNTWVLGFANEGPTEEPITISSISEFESVFGTPTNAAERYFYHTSREYLNSGGNLLATRIPYGDNAGNTYGEKFGALVFPVIPASSTYVGASVESLTSVISPTSAASLSLTAAGTFVLGQPHHIELTEDQYLNVLNNNVSWASSITSHELSATLTYSSIGKAGLVILDSTRSAINNLQEGYYIGVVDNAYANPAQDYNDVINIKSLSDATTYTTINSARIPFALSASNTGAPGSVSEILESVPSFTFDTASYNDTIALGLFKVRKSIYAGSTNNVLDKVLVETFAGSLDASRMVADPLGGPQKSFFIENVVNQNSNNIKVLVNPWISKKSEWNSADGNPDKSVRFWKTTGVTNASSIALNANTRIDMSTLTGSAAFVESRSLYATGTYATKSDVNKNIGNIPGKLDRIFACVSNPDVVPIDITVDGGLSTIWATVKTVSATTGTATFDDTVFMTASGLGALSAFDGSTISSDPQDAHEAIFGRFNTFAESTRKDHIHITDPLRQLFVNGSDYKVFTAKCNRIDNPFSKAVYWPLRNLYQAANSSYTASYANWVKVYDSNSDMYCWAPFSGWAARTYAETDRDRFPWIAPAGLTRGTIRNVVDLAINPNQKERDLLYRIGQNPVCFFPNDGYVIWGQKTLFRKPSAFDRVNVRRLFLALEKPTARVMKYFVFEPNSVFTRTQVVNTLTPLFEQAKRNEGVYDYMIVCDERNNTADVIDRNELIVDIYIKPVRASEFILVNFVATRTSQDFAELV